MTMLERGEDSLIVAEMFGPTFQGEGPSVGQRSVFIRLSRCNLTCTWCDTPFTWDWSRFDPKEQARRVAVNELVAWVSEKGAPLVVITGGEPMLQQSRFLRLAQALIERGHRIEIETNGTLPPSSRLVELGVRFNVSPKLANSGVAVEKRVVPAALSALRDSGQAVFKFVVGSPDELDEVEKLVAEHDLEPVWIMPEGTDPETITSTMRQLADPVLSRGWSLTTRLHVLLWRDERGR